MLCGCPGKPVEVPDAGLAGLRVVDAGAAPAAVIDAGPPMPAQLGLVATATRADGGLELIEKEIDAVKALSIWIPVQLSDYRIRIFDEGDRVVPSDDTGRELDGGIDYAISFLEPLKSGRVYRLTVESQAGHALDGYQDGELVFKVRGAVEPEAQPAKKKPGKKKRR